MVVVVVMVVSFMVFGFVVVMIEVVVAVLSFVDFCPSKGTWTLASLSTIDYRILVLIPLLYV